jgi:hypothetical protein
MKPHPFVVSALKMVCAVAPSWRIIPTPDILDKVCKDPEMRKQVLLAIYKVPYAVERKRAAHSY